MSAEDSAPADPPPPPDSNPPPTPSRDFPEYEWLPPVINSVTQSPTNAQSTGPKQDATLATDIPPPLPPVVEQTPRRAGPLLLMATGVVGAVMLVVVLLGLQYDPQSQNVGYAIGTVVGAIVLWPAVFIGVFSIFRRFRNGRSRAIIMLSVWSLLLLGQLGKFAQHPAVNQPPGVRPTMSTPDAESPLQTETSSRPAPAAVAATPRPAATARVGERFDFSPGSDERLIKRIVSAQESTYRDVVAAYAAECRARPNDAALAVERVRFIERFASAEDVTFATAEADLETAKAYLLTRFGATATAKLYQLERAHGDEFETLANTTQPTVARWTKAEQARFWLLRAQQHTSAVETARTYAASAFALVPEPDSALILARGLIARHDLAEARRVLGHESFATAHDWKRAQQMKLLFEAGARDEAVNIFEQLHAKKAFGVRDVETARHLATAGRVDLARKVYENLVTNRWNTASIARQRFEFELEHGTPAQAASAYRAMRDAGFNTDSFGRARARLLLKHPRAAWTMVDVVSFGAFGILLLFAASLPLVIVLPAHYWGLVRRVKGKAATATTTPWGLRSALLVLSTMCVSLFVGFWIFQPSIFENWTNESQAGTAQTSLSSSAVLGPTFILWGATVSLVLFLLWRARGWRLLGSGVWPVGKAVGLGVGFALAIRFAIGIYITVFGLTNLAVAEATPISTQFFRVALAELGPWAFFGLVALFVPVLEEMLFRGVLLGALAKHVPFWAANVVQSVVFLAMHDEMRLAPFFFAIAFVNGEMVRRSRGLFPGIVLHMVNNAIVALVLIVRGV